MAPNTPAMVKTQLANPSAARKFFYRRRVVVMGLGLHGGALHVTRWLMAHGAQVRVTDVQPAPALEPTLQKLPRSSRLTLVLGRHRVRDFRWAQVVVQNPAVPRESPYLAVARRAGARLENEATLFFQLVGRQRIIGVTGTRGKSTTAALAAAIVRQRFRRTMLGGNIATAPMFAIVERVCRSRDPVVLELSSSQVENLGQQRRSPHVAVVTNVLPDHLNRYRSMAAYAAAKRQLVAHQEAGDFAVLNADNPASWRFRLGAPSTVIACSRRAASFAPRVFFARDWIWWHGESRAERLLPVSAVRLFGAHNLDNILAAVAVGKIYRVPPGLMRSAVSGFSGLPFRQQLIGSWRGVRYLNDTTATTPEATVAALTTVLERWPEIRGRIILIAGGSDKRLPKASFARLGKLIAAACKAVVAFAGAGSKRLVAEIPAARGARLSIVSERTTMAQAVAAAQALSSRGDLVLLSPACASFGLFQHEFDRGEQFTQCVKQPVV